MRFRERLREAVAAFAGRPDPEKRVAVVPQIQVGAPLNEQRLLNDDSVYTVYNLFSDVLLGPGWHWEGDDAERLEELTDAIEDAEGFSQMLDEIAATPFQRFAAIEILWQTANGWTPEGYRVLPPEATRMDIDAQGRVSGVRVVTTAGLQDLPLENAVVYRWRPTFKHPLGQSCYDHLKEVIDFKRRTDAALVRYIERFGGPSLIGWYAPGTPKDEQMKLLTALKTMQSASVGVLPGPRGDEGNNLELLEPKGSSAGIGVALEMIGTYERRIARAVMGSVLAMFESEFGTRAQAETHLDVLKAVIESYQSDIEAPVNAQIVKRVAEYNAGANADLRWKLNAPRFADLQKLAQAIADLATAGFLDVETDSEAVRSMFGLEGAIKPPAPEPEPKQPPVPPAIVIPGGRNVPGGAAADTEA